MNFDEDAVRYRAIIKKHLDENADLLIGLDDPELSQLIDVLVDGIAQAIAASKEEFDSEIGSLERKIGFR